MDMSGWTPVLGKDGAVLGYTADAGTETPLERKFKDSVIEARADAIGEVADLAASPFDLDEVCESGEARIGEPAVDSALGVAWELIQIEQLRQ